MITNFNPSIITVTQIEADTLLKMKSQDDRVVHVADNPILVKLNEASSDPSSSTPSPDSVT